MIIQIQVAWHVKMRAEILNSIYKIPYIAEYIFTFFQLGTAWTLLLKF